MAKEPILEMQGIHKRFPGVVALKNVGIRLFPGEVHALMGQNGAGKSTLIKVLTGVETPDGGDIRLGGKKIQAGSVLEAQDLGISTVYQEVNLCPNLSVAENIFIGRFPMRGPVIDWAAMHERARVALKALNITVDVTLPLSSYPVAIQQMVAIARALGNEGQVLILDEPTSSLDEDEVARLFDALRQLKAKGIAILFVTHFLDQTYAISDRITVLRNGELEGEYMAADLPRLQLINKMVGREIDESAYARQTGAAGAETGGQRAFLSAKGLGRAGAIRPMDLEMRSGKALGLGGLRGVCRHGRRLEWPHRPCFHGRSAQQRHVFLVDRRTVELPGQRPDLSGVLQHRRRRRGRADESGADTDGHLRRCRVHGRQYLYRQCAQLHGPVHRRVRRDQDAELFRVHGMVRGDPDSLLRAHDLNFLLTDCEDGFSVME